MIVDVKQDGAPITLPDTLYAAFTGACFIDGIALPSSSDFSSAVVVGGPYLYKGMGVIANHNNGDPWVGQYEVHTPPIGSDWPNQPSVQAVCGVAGGMVAFATIDSGVPYIQVNNTPLVAPDTWNTVTTISFAENYGPVQAMMEQDGKIYGFIKGKSENYFFIADIQRPSYEYPNMWSYSGPAAASFYPPPKVVPVQNWLMTRRVALYNNRLYALDERNANIVSASRDGMGVTSFPIANDNTGGLLMDEKLQKAYCLSGPPGDVMPYTVSDSGFTAEPNALNGGSGVCPSLHSDLGLLYLIGAPNAQNTIVDMTTDSPVNLVGDLPQSNTLPTQSSTWADPASHILYISGYLDEHNKPAIVMPYRVTIIG